MFKFKKLRRYGTLDTPPSNVEPLAMNLLSTHQHQIKYLSIVEGGGTINTYAYVNIIVVPKDQIWVYLWRQRGRYWEFKEVVDL